MTTRGCHAEQSRPCPAPCSGGLLYERPVPAASPESSTGRMWGCCRRAVVRISPLKPFRPQGGGQLGGEGPSSATARCAEVAERGGAVAMPPGLCVSFWSGQPTLVELILR